MTSVSVLCLLLSALSLARGGGLFLLGHSRRSIAFISDPVQEAINVRGIFEVGRSFFSCFPNSLQDCWHVTADQGTHPITFLTERQE